MEKNPETGGSRPVFETLRGGLILRTKSGLRPFAILQTDSLDIRAVIKQWQHARMAFVGF